MQQHYFPSDPLPSWLCAAGRGTTRDRRLILSRVNRRDRFRVPARREAAARHWVSLLPCLARFRSTLGDWKAGGIGRMDFLPLALALPPLSKLDRFRLIKRRMMGGNFLIDLLKVIFLSKVLSFSKIKKTILFLSRMFLNIDPLNIFDPLSKLDIFV